MTLLHTKLAQTCWGLPSLPACRATGGFMQLMHTIRSCLPHDFPQCQPHTQQEDAERDADAAAYKVCTPAREQLSLIAKETSPNRPAVLAGQFACQVTTPQGILQHRRSCTGHSA